jgi:hypothetical protein
VYALFGAIENTFSQLPGEMDSSEVKIELVYNRAGNKQVYEGILGSIVLSSYFGFVNIPPKTMVRFPQPTA